MTRVALLLLVVLAAAPAAAQRVGPVDVGPGGRTWCEQGVPTSTLNPVLDSLASRAIAAHEAEHRRQLAPGCDSILAQIQRDPMLRLHVEAEALCAGVHAIDEGRASRAFAGIAQSALLLAAAFPEVRQELVAAHVGVACNLVYTRSP